MVDIHTSIRKSSTWMIARFGISLTMGVFITTYIVRSLSVEDYGIYTVLYSLIGYVGVIGAFGIQSVFSRFIPEALQRKEYSMLKRLVLRGLVLRILLSVTIVCLILMFHGPIGRLLKIEGFVGYFLIFAWGIVLSLEATLLRSVLHSLLLHKYSVIASTLYTVFRGGCLFFLLHLGWGIRGLLWTEVISWGLWTFLQGFFYYVKFVRQYVDKERSVFPLRRLFRYGGLAALNKLGGSLFGVSTDFFIITAFLGPGAVAFYAFADRVIKLFVNAMPHIVLVDVIQPAFVIKYVESGNKQNLADMFNLLIKIGAFSVFPLAVGIFVLGDKMIAIVFKPEYLPAKHILWVLIIFTVINIFANPTRLVLQATEQIQINLYGKIFSIYNLIVALLVIERYGVMGVVFVTCSANLMNNIFLYYCTKKIGGLSVDWRSLCIIATNTTVMALVLWALRGFAYNFISLALVASVGALSYLIASWLNKAFSPQERLWINRIAPMPIFVF